jgi:hypothetical protein
LPAGGGRFNLPAVTTRKIELLPDVLRRVVRSLDIEAKLLSHAVEPVWARVAGPRLASHTRATQLRNGVLTIEARSASWLNEVSMLREEVRERLNTELGGIRVRDIRFRIGNDFPPMERPPPPVEVTEIEVASARRTLGTGVGADLAARAYVLASKRSLH